MAILSSMIASLSTYYPDGTRQQRRPEHYPRAGQGEDDCGLRLQEIGRPAIHLSAERPFVLWNFLHMMFAFPTEPYIVPKTMRNRAQ